MSRAEELLEALIDESGSADFEPRSRFEHYLKCAINKSGLEHCPEPVSRGDLLLKTLAEKIIEGGGGGEHYTGETTVNPSADSDTVLSTANKIVDSDITVKKVGKPFIDSSKLNCLYYFFSEGKNADLIEYLPLFDTINVKNMSYMFWYYSALTNVPLFDTSNVTNMERMFHNCSQLTTVPLFDTRNVITMTGMFAGCSKLTTVPLFDTSNVKNMSYMFNACTALMTVPLFDTSNVNDMCSMFLTARVTTVPLFDTSNVTNMNSMFYFCQFLKTVPSFDTSKVTNMNSMFYNCLNLTEVWIKNIKVNLQVGSGTSWGHLLTVDSLVHLCQELVNVGSSRTLTVGSANLEKLASVYVKLTVPEEEDTTGKLPCVVCESTDEGAMLIKDYVTLKQWQLA